MDIKQWLDLLSHYGKAKSEAPADIIESNGSRNGATNRVTSLKRSGFVIEDIPERKIGRHDVRRQPLPAAQRDTAVWLWARHSTTPTPIRRLAPTVICC